LIYRPSHRSFRPLLCAPFGRILNHVQDGRNVDVFEGRIEITAIAVVQSIYFFKHLRSDYIQQLLGRPALLGVWVIGFRRGIASGVLVRVDVVVGVDLLIGRFQESTY
jgi:hypothetical protein